MATRLDIGRTVRALRGVPTLHSLTPVSLQCRSRSSSTHATHARYLPMPARKSTGDLFRSNWVCVWSQSPPTSRHDVSVAASRRWRMASHKASVLVNSGTQQESAWLCLDKLVLIKESLISKGKPCRRPIRLAIGSGSDLNGPLGLLIARWGSVRGDTVLFD